MRMRHMIGGCIAAVTAAMASAGSARAEPPASTTLMELTTPVIACDTKDQMMQVVQSINIGRIEDHDRTVDLWVSNVGNGDMGFYVLWVEEIQSTKV
jgi:hypothetical protein